MSSQLSQKQIELRNAQNYVRSFCIGFIENSIVKTTKEGTINLYCDDKLQISFSYLPKSHRLFKPLSTYSHSKSLIDIVDALNDSLNIKLYLH